MKPITRKELYLNKIVGNNEYETPEKPISEEEFFFAEILGEAVQAPEPLSRYQKYLAKIAGRNISVPKPLTRLELFLAKACGMDIETPTPVTREEIFWSNYSAIVDFEVEGIPPLTYKAVEGTLKNYRIYGNTVGGESVGDKTGNLFDKSGSQYGNNLHWIPTCSLVYSDTYYGSPIMDVTGLNTITRSYTGTGANYFLTSDLSQFVNVSNVGTVDAGVTVNVPDGYTKYVFNIPNTIRPDSIMVNSGSTVLPYEPYGYKVAVTVSNGTDTQTIPIYLPEQIRKVRDYSDYIDYGSQKFVHRVVRKVFDGTEQFKAGEKTNVIEYFVPGITMGDPENSINCTSNHISVVSGNENWANRRVPNAQYVSSFFQNNASQIRFVWNDNNGVLNLAGLTSQLSTWYANGDPLIVDYIIVEPVEEQVTLPALPTIKGTNVLSVGTAVQPSKVYVKYKGERQ